MPLAPAISRTLLSSFQLVLGRQPNLAPLHQTHRYLCFQIVQAPKRIRELSPFLTNPRVSSSILFHHSRKEGSVGCGVRSWRVTFCRKLNQNILKRSNAMIHELILSLLCLIECKKLLSLLTDFCYI
jgi:hypothetical protein